MTTPYILICISVMALVTYLIRLTPMVVFRKKIKNKWIQSFLYYVPYVVLSAMTVPAVFSSTGSVSSAVAGFLVGVVLAFFRRGLLTVAVGAALTAFIMQVAGL